MDFAGGTVIHINAGIAGLVLSYLVGKRKAHSLEEVANHHLLSSWFPALHCFGLVGLDLMVEVS